MKPETDSSLDAQNDTWLDAQNDTCSILRRVEPDETAFVQLHPLFISGLAVPSYGSNLMKPASRMVQAGGYAVLAVPSYGSNLMKR